MPTFQQVLEAEKKALARTKPDDQQPGEPYGLAFSGGGIRSATFNLGVLQGLLLAKAKYLSTVSGGGYIGGWLAGWIKRAPGGMSEVQDKLGNYERHRDLDGDVAEPKQINFLRDYSNYLTPRKGLFGADTWAAIATYLRNVLLNQVILISFLGALLLIPWFLGTAMHALSNVGAVEQHGAVVILSIATLLLLWAIGWASAETARCSLPAKKDPAGRPKDPRKQETAQGADQKRVIWFVAFPLFLSGSVTVFAFWLWPALGSQSLVLWALAGALVYSLAHVIGLFVRISVIKASRQADHKLTWPQIIGIPLTALLAGIVGGFLVKLCYMAISLWGSSGLGWGGPSHTRPWHAIACGPPLLVVAFLLAGSLHIGLLKLLIGPEEQEWWGRLGGLLLLATIGWAGVFGLAIFAPHLAMLWPAWVKTKVGLVLGWVGTTAFGLLSGRSGKTSGQGDKSPALELAVAISPYVFVLGLLILLSLGARYLAVWPASSVHYWASADNVSLRRLLVSIPVLGGLLYELFASTTDRSKFVYLSDGGHFENLAIYELVRRRCKYIISCDADADSGMTFGDLGNAIRKCRSDFGVEITIDPTPVRLPNPDGFASVHGVAGAIRYPRLSDEEPSFRGQILYIKPTITPNTPRAVLAYRDSHPGFPDQTTADQWFDESQFESYRRLGLHSFQTLAGIAGSGRPSKPTTIKDLFDNIKAQAR